MPGIQIRGKPSSSAAGGRSFADGIIRNSAGTGGTTPPSGSGPAGSGSIDGIGAAAAYATSGLRSMASAANTATAALTAFQRRLDGFNFGRGGGGGRGTGGSGGGGGSRAGAGQGRGNQAFTNYEYSTAQHFNRKYNQNESAKYRYMRSEADAANRDYDRAREAAWNYDYSDAQHDNREFDRLKKAKQRETERTHLQQERNRKPSFFERGGAGGKALGMASSHLGGLGVFTGVGEALMETPELAPFALALAPQIMSAGYGAFMGATSTYRNFGMSAYGMARAGGFNGDSFISNLTDNGTGKSSSFNAKLAAVGYGSTDAMKAMQQFGIGATSQSGWVNGAYALGSMGLNSRLGDMDQGQLIAAQRMLVSTLGGQQSNIGGHSGYGSLGVASSIYSNTAAMSDFLANATSRGLDKSQMIQSMTNSLQVAASAGGLGANLASSIAFNQGEYSNDNAAARSGASSADFASSAAASFNNPFSSNVKGMMLTKAALGIHSASDVERIIGANAYNQLTASGNAAGMMQIRELTDPNTPAPVKAALLGSVASSDPNAMTSMAMNWSSGFSNNFGTRAAVFANLTGVNQGTAYNTITGYLNQNGGYAPGEDSYYQLKLSSMGIPASKIAALIQAGKSHGVNPLILGGQWLTETGPGWKGQKSSAGAQGPMQFMPATFKQYGKGNINNFGDSVNAAANYDASLFSQYGVMGGLARYNGETDGKNIYPDTVFGKVGGGTPSDNSPVTAQQQVLLNDAATNSNLDLDSAKATFDELEGSVDMLANAVQKLQGAVTALANSGNSSGGMGRNINPYIGQHH